MNTPRYSVSRIKDHSPNKCYIGPNVAVLLCPAPGGKHIVGVPVSRFDLYRVLAAGFWRIANTYPKPLSKSRFYAYTFIRENGKRKRVYMHRFVTSAPIGTEVDHGNHRGTDNRRQNLQVGTHATNMRNQERFASTAIALTQEAAQ